MLTFDSLPQARVVRNAGQLVAPPPAPRVDDQGSLATFLAYAVGLWPLTAIVMLMFGLLYMAGMNGAP